jgi:hypothetical protein
MSIIVFLFLYLILMWGVFTLCNKAGPRWPVLGVIFEVSRVRSLLALAVLTLLVILLGAIGIKINW